VDFGYAYLFTSDSSIDQTRGSQLNFGRVAGTYEASIHIVSVQYSTSF